jgi:hypothetical protein
MREHIRPPFEAALRGGLLHFAQANIGVWRRVGGLRPVFANGEGTNFTVFVVNPGDFGRRRSRRSGS